MAYWRMLFLLLFSAAQIACAEPLDAELAPLSAPDAGFTVDDQRYLLERCAVAASLVPAEVTATTSTVADFRKTPLHDRVKASLRKLVDNEHAWPEYIYVARMTPDRKKFEYMVSSSDVIEGHPITAYDLNTGMPEAFAAAKPFVTDFCQSIPAVYMPVPQGQPATGFVVLVKQSWEPNQRRVLAPQGFEQVPPASASELEAADPAHLLDFLAGTHDLWAGRPQGVRSLAYDYEAGAHAERVELANSRGLTRSWRGVALNTALQDLVRVPRNFEATVAKSGTTISITAQAREHFFIEGGQGVTGSFSGYFSRGPKSVTVDLDRKTMLPCTETWDDGRVDYADWKELRPGKWAPMRITISSGDMGFDMQFRWVQDKLWILERSKRLDGMSQSSGGSRTRNILIDDEAVTDRITKEDEETSARIALVQTMLDHNRIWLDPGLSRLDSIEYTFRTVREDVDERAYLGKDGLAIVEVVRDGLNKMGDGSRERRIILPSDTHYQATRDEEFATEQPGGEKGKEPWARQLRRYLAMGVQFDLPLFRYPKALRGADIRDDGTVQWNGQSVRQVEVRNVADAVFGAGTMLGFTSWCYVHHIYPDREVFHIDPVRNVPLHETLYSGKDRFEITFKNYREVLPGQFAPMRIEINSPDYFTCIYNFQLAGDVHWMLKDAEAWFKPDEKSTAMVLDVRSNSDSTLRSSALAQVETGNNLFSTPDATTASLSVPTYAFRLGRHISVAADSQDREEQWNMEGKTRTGNKSIVNRVLFTMNSDGDLVASCTLASRDFSQRFELTLNGVLYDDAGRTLASDSQTTVVELLNKFLREPIQLNFGKTPELAKTTHFSLSLIKGRKLGIYHGHGMWILGIDGPHESGDVTTAARHFEWDLKDGLTAEDPSLRSAALERLMLWSPSNLLEDRNHIDRHLNDLPRRKELATTATLFPSDPRKELVGPLLWLLDHTTSEGERAKVALTLGWFDDQRPIQSLARIYDEGTPAGRAAAATSLGILGDSRGKALAIASLKSDDTFLRANAVRALTCLGGSDAVAALSVSLLHQKPWNEPAKGDGSYVHDPYGRTRSLIMRAAILLKDPAFIAPMKALENDPTYRFADRGAKEIREYIEGK